MKKQLFKIGRHKYDNSYKLKHRLLVYYLHMRNSITYKPGGGRSHKYVNTDSRNRYKTQGLVKERRKTPRKWLSSGLSLKGLS